MLSNTTSVDRSLTLLHCGCGQGDYRHTKTFIVSHFFDQIVQCFLVVENFRAVDAKKEPDIMAHQSLIGFRYLV